MADRCEALPTIVVGAGGHGAEVATYLSDLIREGWRGTFLGFLDDLESRQAVGQGRILGRVEDFSVGGVADGQNIGYMVAVGHNRVRRKLVERLESRFAGSMSAWTLIHPLAYVGEGVGIGAGTLLAPYSVVTSRISLGRHVIVNVKASISHDAVIGDYATINPAATICGNVKVGEGAYVGAGAVVREQISIGAWSMIGAGAVVVDDIPPFSLAVGVPARVIRSLAP